MNNPIDASSFVRSGDAISFFVSLQKPFRLRRVNIFQLNGDIVTMGNKLPTAV
jgi:hypothetical protein